MVHKWWNVLKSRWGMKEPIKRLLGSGFGSVSTQCYPSVQQHRGELSVFICPRHANRLREREEGGLTSITPKFRAKFIETPGDARFAFFPPAQSENTIRLLQSIHQKNWGAWGSVSNLQVLGPTAERLLWLAPTVLTPKLQPLLQQNCASLLRSVQTGTTEETERGNRGANLHL